MALQNGWMEQRRHERISSSLKVSYRVLGDEENKDVLAHPRYRHTTADHLPGLSQKFHVYHAVTRDISEGGLSIMGEHPFSEGEKVEVSLQLPQYKVPVTLLAEVARSSSIFNLGKTMYNAGVRILALNREDMERLGRYLLSEKLRQQAAKGN
jgi:PilZ domain